MTLRSTTQLNSTQIRSVGCILAELLLRKPLFAGDDYISQIKLIHGVLGTQSPADLDYITSERAKKFVQSLPRKPDVPFQQVIPDCRKDPHLLNLVQNLLTFNPEKRITVDNALAHPFLAGNRVPESEVTASFTYEDEFAFESEDPESFDKERIQSLMWEQLRSMHPYIPSLHP